MGNIDSFWEDIGHSVAGPVLLGFAKWVLSHLEQNNCTSVYFLSRDGQIVQEICNYLRRSNGDGNTNAEFHYLLASRRALNMAQMTRLDAQALSFLSNGSGQIPIGDYLRRINLEPDKHQAEIKAAGFANKDHCVAPESKDVEKIKALFQKIETTVLENARKERETYTAYLRSLNFEKHRKIAIVDIGWNCSLQYALGRLLTDALGDRAPQLMGYYLGTFPTVLQFANNPTQGYIMDRGLPHENHRMIAHCIEFVEFLFTSKDSSFIRIDSRGNPEFDPHSMSESWYNAFQAMRSGTWKYIKSNKNRVFSLNEALSPLRRVLTAPNLQEAKRIGQLEAFDGIGTTVQPRKIAFPSSRLRNLVNPLRLKLDYKYAYWKRGYYEQLTPIERWLLKKVMPSFRVCDLDR